jgi:hypothetical protein
MTKTRQNLVFLKIGKLTYGTNASNTLTIFKHEAFANTGKENDVNMLKFDKNCAITSSKLIHGKF